MADDRIRSLVLRPGTCPPASGGGIRQREVTRGRIPAKAVVKKLCLHKQDGSSPPNTPGSEQDKQEGGEKSGNDQSLQSSAHHSFQGLSEARGRPSSKSPGFVSVSSASAASSGERSLIGVSGGSGESGGGAFACRARSAGCSSQFMRLALKGGKLWWKTRMEISSPFARTASWPSPSITGWSTERWPINSWPG